MSLGQQLIGGMLEASYTPQVNPELANATHQDSNGNFVHVTDDGTQTVIPQYVQPSWWQRAVSPEARQVQMMNAAAQAEPYEMKRKALATRAAAFAVHPSLTPEVYDQTADPLFSPVNRNTQIQAAAFGDTGAPKTIGNLTGLSDINTAHQMLANSQAALGRNNVINATMDASAANELSKQVGVEPLMIQHTINGLRAAIGQDPTEAQIMEAVNAVKLSQAKQGQSDIPIDTGTQHLMSVRNNYLAGMMPDEDASSPLISRVTNGGVLPSYGRLNPNYVSPTRIQMAALAQGMGPVANPTETRNMPSGKTYNIPIINGPIKPTLGTGYTPEEVKDKVVEHNDTQDEHVKNTHDAAQATIAAKIAELKATQKRLQADHSGSRLNTLVGTLKGMGDTAIGGDAWRELGRRAQVTKNWWTE